MPHDSCIFDLDVLHGSALLGRRCLAPDMLRVAGLVGSGNIYGARNGPPFFFRSRPHLSFASKIKALVEVSNTPRMFSRERLEFCQDN